MATAAAAIAVVGFLLGGLLMGGGGTGAIRRWMAAFARMLSPGMRRARCRKG